MHIKFTLDWPTCIQFQFDHKIFKAQLINCTSKFMSGIFSQIAITQINRDQNKKLVRILHTLLQIPESVPFRKPVPHKALKLQDYRNIVKKPIDLNLIRRQYNQQKYKLVEEVLDDIQLCWENCKMYNSPDSDIFKQAEFLEAQFFRMVTDNFQEYNTQEIKQKLEEREIYRRNRVQSNQSNKQQNCIFQHHSLNYSQEFNEGSKQSSQVKSRKQLKNKQKGYQKIEPMEVEDQVLPDKFDKKKKQTKQSKAIMEQESSKNDYNSGKHEQEDSLNQQLRSENQDLPPADPIIVNLRQRPNKQQILNVSKAMKSAKKSTIEHILEILYTSERELLSDQNARQMSFCMTDMHMATYMKICKVLKMEGGQNLIQ